MKTKFLLILLFFGNLAIAQNLNVKKSYQFIDGAKIQPCISSGDPSGDKIIAEAGWQVRIKVVLESENLVIFSFLKWKDTLEKKETKIKFLEERNKVIVFDSNDKKKYYSFPLDQFLNELEPVSNKFPIEFGSATIPIKIRPGNDNIPFDFNGNFNAGVGLNLKIEKVIGLYGGISLTSVPIDSVTTGGFISSSTNAAALTPTFGLIKEVAGVQIGAFIGFDFLARDLGKKWIYQGRRWFGIGIGVNIFDISTAKTNDDPQ